MICPQCGAELSYKGIVKVCDYCGYQEKDVSLIKDYNVQITCTEGSKSPIRIAIPDAGITFDINSGMSETLKLVPGPHKISFAASNILSTKMIEVRDNNDVVNISVCYDTANGGSLHIRIDQPNPEKSKEKLPESHSKLALISMISTFTFVGSPLGIILAVIDLCISRKAGRTPNSFAVTGLILGIMNILIAILLSL